MTRLKIANRRFALFLKTGTELRVFANPCLEGYLKGAVVFCRYKNSEYLKAYAEKYGFEVAFLEDEDWEMEKSRSFSLCFEAKRSRAKVLGQTLYKYGKVYDDKVTIKDRLVKGNFLAHRILEKFFRLRSKNFCYDRIEGTFKDYGITDLLLVEYGWAVFKFAKAGRNIGCQIWSFVSSWKDVAVSPFIPFECDAIFAWSNDMVMQLRKGNSKNYMENIHAVGSPRLLCFGNNLSCPEVVKQLSKDYILYTCLNPDIYKDELALVNKIIIHLKEAMGTEFPGFVIKTNPMDKETKRWGALIDHDVVVIESDWEFLSKDFFFNLPSYQSEQEWPGLISNSRLVMGVASTVSFEAIASKKAVININFDADGLEHEDISNLTYSPFYKPFLENEAVVEAKSFSEVCRLVSFFTPKVFSIEDMSLTSSRNKFNEIIDL